MDGDEITAKDAAEILGVSAHHVRWYYHNGYLPGRVVFGVMVFPKKAVQSLAKNKPERTGRPKGAKDKKKRKRK